MTSSHIQHQYQTSAYSSSSMSKCSNMASSALIPPAGTCIGLRLPVHRLAFRSSFAPSSFRLPGVSSSSSSAAAAPRFSMRVASKQAYICRDCGYIYNDRKPFDSLPDSYFCPVCGAPKRRFRSYEPAVTKNANSTDVRKARKEQLKRDEAIGRALPIAIVVGIGILGGIYVYLNNTF